ncbi:hypothetical protein [Mesorhizobium marinum]|uniref:Uncharacterized protein n=1 Tax=Mesorhizobium marinum TaxID=3228790 RepID=A0ABV3R4T5_9HYPH
MTEATMTALDDLLGDPMVQMVMARDGVRPGDLRDMLERDRRRAIEKRLIPPAHVIAASKTCSLCL